MIKEKKRGGGGGGRSESSGCFKFSFFFKSWYKISLNFLTVKFLNTYVDKFENCFAPVEKKKS